MISGPNRRVLFVDLLRALAVVMMITGHTIDAMLGAAWRQTGGFYLYELVRGMTAPLFLFISGFAFILAVNSSWEEYLRPSRLLFRRMGRAALLLLIGYGLHLPYFSFRKIVREASQINWADFLKVDILQCLAVTLLALLLLLMLAREIKRFALLCGLAAFAMALSTPLVWEIDFARFLPLTIASYFNQKHLSPFPLFPWSAYLFSGAAAASIFVLARKKGAEDKALAAFPLIGFCLIALAYGSFMLPFDIYPAHDFWRASPALFSIKLGVILLVCYVIYRCAGAAGSSALSRLAIIGRNSLFIYVVHLMIVYGSPINRGLGHRWGRMLSPAESLAIALSLVSAMVALACIWDLLKSNDRRYSRAIKLAAASLILVSFFTREH